MRLLMYSQDGMGLGHLRRSRNIAQEVLARAPDSNVLILAGAPEETLQTLQQRDAFRQCSVPGPTGAETAAGRGPLERS